MLTTLRIKNLALVEDLTIEFQPGYNVITGETGAGKSILIGALNLVLGERAERTLVRSGSDNCTVEAVFDVKRLKAPLSEFLDRHGLEPCEDGQLALKRSFTIAGANRQFINGSATTLNVLYQVGEWLVDIHGPHEHQSLLQPARQLDLLDAFGGLEPERNELAALVKQRGAFEHEKSALIGDDATHAQQMDLLQFQIREITEAKLVAGEEEQVEAEYRRAGNAAKLLQLSRTSLDLLSENEESIISQAGIVGRTLQELKRIDPSAEHILTAHEQAVSALHELQEQISKYEGKVEVDPERLQQLEERLGLIQSLKRKYGATVADVIAFGEKAAEKLKKLEGREAELKRINGALEKLEKEIMRAAKELSEKRRKAAPQLSKAVSRQLADLGFKQSRFEVQVGEEVGADFQFSPNPGEPLRALRAIASSGELARVMLAIKTVLASEDQVPVLVFDEVDANVGGETAVVVGEKMRQIASKRQVLCITHLPQVAAPAGAHLMVSKEVKAGRTISEIKLLGRTERVTEVARMLGGQTQAARKHAEEMLAANARE